MRGIIVFWCAGLSLLAGTVYTAWRFSYPGALFVWIVLCAVLLLSLAACLFYMRRNGSKLLLIPSALIGLLLLYVMGGGAVNLGQAVHWVNHDPDEYGAYSIAGGSAEGGCQLSPDSVEIGRPASLKLALTMGGRGMAEGGGIILRMGKVIPVGGIASFYDCSYQDMFSDTLQVSSPSAPGYVSVKVSPGAALVLSKPDAPDPGNFMVNVFALASGPYRFDKSLPAFYHRNLERRHEIHARLKAGELRAGDTVEFTLGDSSGGGPGWMMPRGEADVDIVPYVDEDGKGVYRMLEGFVTLTVGGGQAEKLEIICPSIAATGENITLAVRAVDREGYLSGGCRASFEVLPVDGLILPENGFTFSSEDRGVKTITARVTVPGTFRVAVRGLAPGDVFISNPINVSEIPGGRIYWGDLHQHSALGKDANRSPEWVFENNKRRDRMDFAAVSVHDIFDYYCLPLTAQEWDYLCGVADRYNMEGGFVTLRSFEWTDLPRGHRNVYYAPGEASPVVSYEAAAGPVALEEKLEGHRCLVIPHHTAWRLMYSGKGYEWGRVGWGQQRLVEIYSKHGSSDYHAGPLPIHRDVTHWFIRLFGGTNRAWDGSGSYVREALAQGYRLGITAGGDSHWARGGSAFGTGLIEDYPRGLQAVCADNLTRGSLFDAMWQRRTYATTGARIIVGFEVNGAPMGSEIAHGGKPVAISFTVNGTGPVTNVEVWKYSADGWQPFNFPGGGKLDLAGSFCDYAASGDSLYFLRVVQQDGNIAWSSPIWVSGR